MLMRVSRCDLVAERDAAPNSPNAPPPPSPSAGYSKNALGAFFCGNGLLVSVSASIFARTFNHAPKSLSLIKV